MKSKCMHNLYWYGLYRQAYDLWCSDSYSHPAKMAPGLCFRILQHLEELGFLKKSDIILDPMTGIGTTNICAGAMGYPSISVELEGKFVDLEKQNKEYAERKLYKKLDWEIIQGDSRRLSELLQDKGLKTLTSPPYEGDGFGKSNKYSGNVVNRNQQVVSRNRPSHIAKGQKARQIKYADQVEGQIGGLKSIMSPPFGDMNHPTNYLGKQKRESCFEYSDNPDNIGNLPDKPLKAVMSPPYDNARNTSQEYDDKYDLRRPPGIKWGRESFRGRYGDTPGQIGKLKSVMSPPYEATSGGHGEASQDRLAELTDNGMWARSAGGRLDAYGQSEGQIGKEQQENYLSAMAKVYSEIAKVSDVLVVVVKNPTRNGKLRRLDLDTIKILEMSGWRIHCQHRSLLFEEIEQATLFGETEKKVKGRLSFFKRLAYIKGSPVANWEDIIFATT